MNGSKKRVENGPPPEGPYIIRTGFYLDDDRTGKRFAVLTCSDDQNGGSWLEEEASIAGDRDTCRGDLTKLEKPHKKAHPVISFREAVEWGVLDVSEGCVLIAHDSLLRTLARRIA